ncbi:MAG TPA: nucleoside hydrolase [Propionibacteriaceae bacterium]|nr:nucleoside hydrolase [Propionibacteriaceae bacterium]
MPRRLAIDVDTGTDDALALLYALGHPDLEVLGISCVTGNVTVDQVVINSCNVLDAAGAGDIPIAAGAVQPLLERARREGGSHGPDGLGGIELPQTSRQRSPVHAVELLHRLIMDSPEPVTLVTLAPKTNLAMLLTRYPEVAASVDQMIFMGGSASEGNTTTVAEFNVWQDPEAARCVIESSIPTTMYPFELFSRLAVSQGVADRFRAHDHPAIRLAGDLLHRRRTSSHGSSHDQVGLLGDAGAMVLLTNPELFVIRELPVHVNLDGIGRGQTVVDHQSRQRRTAVALDLDAEQAASAFVKVIDGYAAWMI